MTKNPTIHFTRTRRIAHALRFAALLLTTLTAGLAAGGTPAAPRTVTIAIVRDGAGGLLDGVETAFRQETLALTAGRATLVFKEGGEFDAGWREDGAGRALDAALADPSVDHVLTLGVRVTAAAAAADRVLNKPVIGGLVQETDLFPLPIDADGHSAKENFAVVALPSRAAGQLVELRTAVPFDSLHVLVDEFLAPDRAAIGPWVASLEARLGVEVELVPLGTDAGVALDAIGADARVVMLFPAVRMDGPERAALLQGLTARKLSVLSFLGQPEVETGALAGVLPNPRSALARRLAINLDQLISGTPAGELPLRIDLPHQLYLNEGTAGAIGFAFGFDAMNRAILVGRASSAGGEPLTLRGAMSAALEGNFALRAQQAATESSGHTVRSARGALLPQVAATQSFNQIDGDRAAASGGAQPETSYRAGLSVSQAIYDDEAFTRVRIARESRRQAGYLEEVERLDTAEAAGQAFLQLLSAQASLRVAEDNYEVTMRNLELARLRERVGTSGPEEGYRFESLAAQQRSELAEAHAQVDRARVALNRELGAGVGTRWQAVDVALEDPEFSTTTGRVIELINDRAKLDRFRAFAATYSAAHSPDIAALEQGVATQRLSAAEKSRRRYSPRITASLSASRTLHTEAGGPSLAEQFQAAGIPIQSAEADRNDWSVGVTASIPLFSGGSLAAEARKARSELRRAEFTRDDARHAVMAQTQAALFAAESAYANIGLSRRSAELAGRNLDVVQEKYERGSVSMVTLLDAQNAAFAQRQAAEAAVYQFLSRLLQFQRSLGWIEALATAAEKEAWLREVEQAVAS